MDSFETPYEEDSEYIECTVSSRSRSRLFQLFPRVSITGQRKLTGDGVKNGQSVT